MYSQRRQKTKLDRVRNQETGKYASASDMWHGKKQEQAWVVRNNYNNNHDDIYSAVIYGASHMREFTAVPLGRSRSAPGGRQLVGQTENLVFESACRLL